MKKYEHISWIRTLCLQIVIISHCMLFYADEAMFAMSADFSSPVVKRLCSFLDVTVMAAFVFCSGFLYASGLSKGRPVKEEILLRVKRLILPYYIYGTLWLVPLYTLFDIKSYGRPGDGSLIKGYAYMLIGIFSDHLWFLWMLFWVNLFFILIRQFLRGPGFTVAAVLSAALVWADTVLLKDVSCFKLSQFAPYVFCCLAGIVFFYLDERIGRLPAYLRAGIGALLLVIIAVYSQNKPESRILFFAMKMLSGIMFYFIFSFLSGTRFCKRLMNSRIYAYLERYSVDIYIFSLPTIYLIFRIIYPYIGRNVVLCTITNAVLTMAAVTLVIWCRERIRGSIVWKKKNAKDNPS